MTLRRKPEYWQLSIDYWRTGAKVTDFMADQIAGLRDADGEPLPESARRFLEDLIFCRVKPRYGRAHSKQLIQEAYRTLLILEKHNEAAEAGMSPSERAIAHLAADLNMSEASVSAIVHPRKARQT